MRVLIAMGCLLASILSVITPHPILAEDEEVAFAVVSEQPKDRTHVAAKVSIEGTVSDLKLLASDPILSNLIWKKLEICHAMKLEGRKVQEGFRVTSVRVIEGAMLPMTLQGYAGDCLLRKALDIAPYAD
jgi:hypothetical protein